MKTSEEDNSYTEYQKQEALFRDRVSEGDDKNPLADDYYYARLSDASKQSETDGRQNLSGISGGGYRAFRDSRFSEASIATHDSKEKFDFKVILLGDIYVGKTAIIRRLIYNEFKSDYKCNIGVELEVKSMVIDEKTVAGLRIWDTAGDEKYRAVTKSYYHDADGIILVFDLTQPSSFDSLQNWLKSIEEIAPKDAIIFLVANKCDLGEQRKISSDEIESFSDSRNLFCVEVSAKKGNNITLVFEKMAKELVNKAKKLAELKKEEHKKNTSILQNSIHNSKKAEDNRTSKCC